jgi:hypothetical protein
MARVKPTMKPALTVAVSSSRAMSDESVSMAQKKARCTSWEAASYLGHRPNASIQVGMEGLRVLWLAIVSAISAPNMRPVEQSAGRWL